MSALQEEIRAALRDVVAELLNADQPPWAMDPATAAHHLRVSERTVRRWVATGVIPALQDGPGGRIVISRSALEAAMQQRSAA